jgi:phosphoribosylformylglycinamidine (FGAM) synthase-like amidotransferase family enzyme
LECVKENHRITSLMNHRERALRDKWVVR